MKTWVFRYIDTFGKLKQKIVPADWISSAVYDFDEATVDDCIDVVSVTNVECDEYAAD